MTTLDTNLASVGRPAPRGRFPGLTHMMSLARSRRALAELDDAALRDVGLTLDEARTEAARPAWDVPSHWMRLR
ncbi:MAG: DUF1127 domain-containing protein [Pseudomonadota bacterium]